MNQVLVVIDENFKDGSRFVFILQYGNKQFADEQIVKTAWEKTIDITSLENEARQPDKKTPENLDILLNEAPVLLVIDDKKKLAGIIS